MNSKNRGLSDVSEKGNFRGRAIYFNETHTDKCALHKWLNVDFMLTTVL